MNTKCYVWIMRRLYKCRTGFSNGVRMKNKQPMEPLYFLVRYAVNLARIFYRKRNLTWLTGRRALRQKLLVSLSVKMSCIYMRENIVESRLILWTFLWEIGFMIVLMYFSLRIYGYTSTRIFINEFIMLYQNISCKQLCYYYKS